MQRIGALGLSRLCIFLQEISQGQQQGSQRGRLFSQLDQVFQGGAVRPENGRAKLAAQRLYIFAYFGYFLVPQAPDR